jgi:hypothetical protein
MIAAAARARTVEMPATLFTLTPAAVARHYIENTKTNQQAYCFHVLRITTVRDSLPTIFSTELISPVMVAAPTLPV